MGYKIEAMRYKTGGNVAMAEICRRRTENRGLLDEIAELTELATAIQERLAGVSNMNAKMRAILDELERRNEADHHA